MFSCFRMPLSWLLWSSSIFTDVIIQISQYQRGFILSGFGSVDPSVNLSHYQIIYAKQHVLNMPCTIFFLFFFFLHYNFMFHCVEFFMLWCDSAVLIAWFGWYQNHLAVV